MEAAGFSWACRFAIALIPKKPHFVAMNHFAADQPLF
jgi:hypothetical protein